MKLNKKGFALIEFLTVMVIMASLFVLVYANASASLAKKEKLIKYQDVYSTYSLFYIRKMYMYEKFDFNNDYLVLYDGENCNYINQEKLDECNKLMNNLGIEHLIITKDVKNVSYKELNSYIKTLRVNSDDSKLYRLVVKTNNGYASSNLYTDNIKRDNNPVCNISYDNGVIIDCISENSFLDSDIIQDDVIITFNNMNYRDYELIKVINEDDHISYKLDLDLDGYEVVLKEGAISDLYHNYNDMVSYTVLVGDNNEA